MLWPCMQRPGTLLQSTCSKNTKRHRLFALDQTTLLTATWRQHTVPPARGLSLLARPTLEQGRATSTSIVTLAGPVPPSLARDASGSSLCQQGRCRRRHRFAPREGPARAWCAPNAAHPSPAPAWILGVAHPPPFLTRCLVCTSCSFRWAAATAALRLFWAATASRALDL